MKAKLICYTLKHPDHKRRSKFKREFLGYNDKSNKGRYHYHRNGLLGNIPHFKPIRSIIIVKPKDLSKVKKVLKAYKAKLFVFDVFVKSDIFN